MIENVIKRDGTKEKFNLKKIIISIQKAIDNITKKIDARFAKKTAQNVLSLLIQENKKEISVEIIQDCIEEILKSTNTEVYEVFHDYRKEREQIRLQKSDLMKAIDKIGIETDRDNANVGNNFSSKMLRIASESNKKYNLAMMPKEISRLHENGDLQYHDLDSFNLTINCLHIPTKEVLEKGFNTGYGYLRKAKRIESAAELSCILLQSTQNDMFGGQSHPDFDNDLASFVDITRNEIKAEMIKDGIFDPENTTNVEQLIKLQEKVEKHVRQAMQGIIYNLNTMHSRAGQRGPF